MISNVLFSARHAYDLAAAGYDQRPWQEFWRLNEFPVLIDWLRLGRGPILDAGAGTGLYVKALVQAGTWAVGLDISSAMLQQATDHSRVPLCLVQGDARKLPFASGSFGQVLFARVLSQIDDLSSLLSESARVLKRSGSLLLSDLDPDHPYMRTELPVGDGKIPVQTYKRPLRQIVREATRHGFALERSAVLVSSGANMPGSSRDSPLDRRVAFLARFIRER